MDSLRHKTKELLAYHCGCYGNLVTIATRYVADAYRTSHKTSILNMDLIRLNTKELQSNSTNFASLIGTFNLHDPTNVFLPDRILYRILSTSLYYVILPGSCVESYKIQDPIEYIGYIYIYRILQNPTGSWQDFLPG